MTLEVLARVLEEPGSTLIVGHEDPDPDSIGSVLAARWALRRIRPGDAIEAASPDPPPLSCHFLPGADQVLTPDEAAARGPWHTLWVVDCEPDRIGSLKPLLSTAQRLVNVDHHATNTRPSGHPSETRLVDPSAAATGLLIYRLIRHWGLSLDREVATHLYTAVAGDTGAFRYSNTTAEALEVAREAVQAGVRPEVVAHNLYERRPFAEVQLLGRALAALERSEDGQIAWLALPHGWIAGLAADAFDGFVNYPRMVEGVEVALLFREVEPGTVRVSLRSQNWVDVSRIASTFGGGGHARAAGCTVKLPLDEAVERVRRAVEAVLAQGPRRSGEGALSPDGRQAPLAAGPARVYREADEG